MHTAGEGEGCGLLCLGIAYTVTTICPLGFPCLLCTQKHTGAHEKAQLQCSQMAFISKALQVPVEIMSGGGGGDDSTFRVGGASDLGGILLRSARGGGGQRHLFGGEGGIDPAFRSAHHTTECSTAHPPDYAMHK